MIKISGGVVCNENGNTVIYKAKCDICNTVDKKEILVNLTSSVIEVSTWKCDKCSHNQVVKIQNKPLGSVDKKLMSKI